MSQTITSLEGYMRKIRAIQPASDEVLLYRGHPERKFRLMPSVLRETKFVAAEDIILRELMASHPAEFSPDSSTLDRLVRVQHYSLPTRLLDVTWNPLVALYFAAKDSSGKTGEVVILRVKKTYLKFFDSDTVSCIANLAQLKTSEKNAINFNLVGKKFNDQLQVDRLLQFIRIEKPHFRSKIRPNDLKSVVCVKPKQSNQRILAQAGAFPLFGLAGKLDTNPVPGITVERVQINGKKKTDIVQELDRMAVNDSTMFPEIEKAAIYIRSKI